MKYRTAKILPEKTLTTTGTETIDINLKDIISRITLAWRIVRSKNNMDSYPYADITKIELVDGSEVLHSMNGGENQALCIYDRKCGSMNNGEHMLSTDEYSLFGIDFGRFLYDPLLAFDPKRYRNPQLKVSYDVDVSDTGVTSGYLEIWADCFDEKVVSPVGFLTSKEHWAGSKPVSSAYEYVDLPTDYPIRKMLVRAYAKSVEPWYQLGGVRIDEENEKRIPFDWDDMEDYTRVMKGIWTPVNELFAGHGDGNGIQFYVTPTSYFLGVGLSAVYVVSNIGFSASSQKGGSFLLKTNGQAAEVNGQIQGYLPNHCFEFQFGDQMDIDDWYDVTKLGSLRLRLKGGSASTTTDGVVLQQLRKY